jgi:single-strand DNA-binding protein
MFEQMDLNKVMIIGRATNNLQVKTIESSGTPVVNFTVATNRKFKNKEGNVLEDAEYHRCVAYGKGAEVLTKYLTKGKRIYIEGRLRTRKRQDSEGNDKFSTEIIVDNFIFLDPKGQEGEVEHLADGPVIDVPDDEDVPF